MGVIGNKSRTGMTNSPEMRKHISEALKGTKCGLGNKSRKGQKRSPEEIAKQRATIESKAPRHCSDAHKRKLSELRKGKPHPAHDKVVAMGKANKGRHATDEARLKMSLARKGKKVSDEAKYKNSCSHKGKPRSESVKQALRDYWEKHKELRHEIGKAAWSDPDKVKIMVSNMRMARQAKPNKVENKILDLLNKYFPNEWEYVGNGKLVIDRKCPDFVRNHGNNQLIELFGDYWHRGENPQDRIDLFKKNGYDTLVIWQSDIKKLHEDGIVCRIQEFMNVATSKD
jgi:hypothetical protein